MDYNHFRSMLDEIFIDTMKMVHRGKDIEQATKEAYGYLSCDPERMKQTDQADFKRLVNGWLANKRFPKQQGKKLINLNNL